MLKQPVRASQAERREEERSWGKIPAPEKMGPRPSEPEGSGQPPLKQKLYAVFGDGRLFV